MRCFSVLTIPSRVWCSHFEMTNLSDARMGDHSLSAWTPDFTRGYKYCIVVIITSGCDLDDLVYEPPRDRPDLWEMGIPDCSAAEFYIHDPNPSYINKLYVNHPDRQYGIWERYADLYPDGDLIFKVGISDYIKDWFFASHQEERNQHTKQQHGRLYSNLITWTKQGPINCD